MTDTARRVERRGLVNGALLIYFVVSQFVALFVVGNGPTRVALLISGIVVIVIQAALFVDWRTHRRWKEFLFTLQPSIIPRSRGAAIRLTLLVLLTVGMIWISNTTIAAVCLAGLIALVVVSLLRAE